jgi:hypothetical protein
MQCRFSKIKFPQVLLKPEVKLASLYINNTKIRTM